MKLLRLGLSMLLMTFSTSMLFAEKLDFYTSEFPPFHYTDKGELTGVAVEVIQAAMEKGDVDYSIKSFPWARSYKIAQEESSSFIFVMSRRAARENLFQWVGIVTGVKHSVFSLKNRDDIVVDSLDDLKKFKIGTLLKGARETYLSSNGFDVQTFQRVAGDTANSQNYKKLKKKRIDVWLSTDSGASYTAKKLGEDSSLVLKKVFEFEEMSKGGYYLAASLDTPKETVEKVSVALESFKKTNEYKMILKKWGM